MWGIGPELIYIKHYRQVPVHFKHSLYTLAPPYTCQVPVFPMRTLIWVWFLFYVDSPELNPRNESLTFVGKRTINLDTHTHKSKIWYELYLKSEKRITTNDQNLRDLIFFLLRPLWPGHPKCLQGVLVGLSLAPLLTKGCCEVWMSYYMSCAQNSAWHRACGL